METRAVPEKDPSNYSLITYAWVGIWAMFGGLVSYFRKVKEGVIHPFSITEFIGELATSAFVGIVTFWLCEAAEIKPLITAALVAISGHMGSRAIFLLERWIAKRFSQYLGNRFDG